ncbi:MAG TPA: type VI secretion system contractile sheath small subunit [Polyangiaceae bacterium]|nr:type VI secretion system contractile sheath small subunit [Polyangiaceae bacterium]
MGKTIQESIFKSRLTITYRTNIDGPVVQESLPYRLLVLGEFSGRAMRRESGDASLLPDLAAREVKSIKRGTTVDDHLKESVPTFRIPKDDPTFKSLRSRIPGHVSGQHADHAEVICRVPVGAIKRSEGGAFPLSGKVRFKSGMSENGLCELEGDLRVGGQLTVTIANKIVTPVSAKLSVCGALRAHYKDPATDKIVGIVSVFIDEELSLPTATAIKLVPREDESAAAGQPSPVNAFDIQFDPILVTVERTLPFSTMDSFSPDAIAAAIPEIHRLQVIKQLLTDLQSGLRNRPELRKLVKTMLPAYGADQAAQTEKLAPFVALKSWAEAAYPLLQVEAPKAAPVAGNVPS